MQFKRRLFLRGLGGACVAAPFLSSVEERAAKAQGTAAPDAPKRLIVMFTHYGCLTDRWFPMNSHGVLTAADYEETSLEVLAPYADKLLLPRGIRAMNQWTADVDLGQGNDPHTQVCGSYFTCAPVTPHEDNPFTFGDARFQAMPVGPSLDHVCARQVNPSSQPLFMRVSGQTDGAESAISFSAGEERFDGLGSAVAAFGALTGVFQDGEALSSDSYRIARGESLLDVVRDDLSTLERFDMSQSDKQKLAAWKELLNSTTGTLRSAGCNEEMAMSLALTSSNLEAADDHEEDNDISTKIAGDLDAADIFSNIAVLSTICDANRVIFLKYPANYTFGGLGLTEQSLEISHRTSTAGMAGGCIPGVTDMLESIDRFYAEKFAHLVGQLDEIDEGDGTLLDHSAAVWFQEMSDGAAHNLNNLPIIQAGGCGGYFKMGQAINVDDASADLHRGTSSPPCEVEGAVTLDSTNTPREFGNAPINKYYCNLMNAIGVKADETGFPTEGGSEEVTHYGMYDRTEDFVGGGTVAPTIHDPGEFEELKAGS